LLLSNQVPYGGNVCVRRQAIGDLRFRTDLGPSCDNGGLGYEDTVFMQELRRRHAAFVPGGGLVFISE
jgi:hypothetical protein